MLRSNKALARADEVGCERLRSVAALVSTSYGPCGGKKLCVGHGGASVVTSEGMEILDAAAGHLEAGSEGGGLQAYASKLVRATCANHVKAFGDGEAPFIVLLSDNPRLPCTSTI